MDLTVFDNYNVWRIVIDIILFREKYSSLKKARKVKQLLDDYNQMEIFRGKYIKTFRTLLTLSVSDIETAIRFHNKYTLNKDIITDEDVQEYILNYTEKIKRILKNLSKFKKTSISDSNHIINIKLVHHMNNLMYSFYIDEEIQL